MNFALAICVQSYILVQVFIVPPCNLCYTQTVTKHAENCKGAFDVIIVKQRTLVCSSHVP